MKLALGPLLWYWPRQAVLDFYASVADAPVDVVYVGETVCARRHELRWQDWLDVAAMLAGSGKEVVLSSLALVEAEADLRLLRRMAAESAFRIEANDMAAVALLAQRQGGLPFVAGAPLNVYNASALQVLQRAGATRWVAPVELPGERLAGIVARTPGIETEVLVHGRLPLAHSARCFTARHYDLQKDHCEYRCLAHPDGLRMKTREGAAFLTINGVQTLSASTLSYLAELPALRTAGVDVVRISPQLDGTLGVVALWREALSGRLAPEAAQERVLPLLRDAPCNGFWHGRPGADNVARTA